MGKKLSQKEWYVYPLVIGMIVACVAVLWLAVILLIVVVYGDGPMPLEGRALVFAGAVPLLFGCLVRRWWRISVPLLLAAVLFNPFVHIHASGGQWVLADLLAGASMVYSGLRLCQTIETEDHAPPEEEPQEHV